MSRRTVSAILTLTFAAALLGARPAAAAAASESYTTYCAVCHGDDGKAQTEEGKKKNARDLTSKKWQDSVDDARLQASITKGRGKMPKWGGKLSEDDIKALVKEVRSFAGK